MEKTVDSDGRSLASIGDLASHRLLRKVGSNEPTESISDCERKLSTAAEPAVRRCRLEHSYGDFGQGFLFVDLAQSLGDRRRAILDTELSRKRIRCGTFHDRRGLINHHTQSAEWWFRAEQPKMQSRAGFNPDTPVRTHQAIPVDAF
jgi:hypothetical protein